MHLTRGAPGPARRALAEALRLNPAFALAHHTLGLVALREGAEGEAIGHFACAAKLNPAEYDALLNLGALLV